MENKPQYTKVEYKEGDTIVLPSGLHSCAGALAEALSCRVIVSEGDEIFIFTTRL